MAYRDEIVGFHQPPVPEGACAFVPGAGPAPMLDLVPWDARWRDQFRELAARVRQALGWLAISIEHVGSTSVPGLPAKPVIDIDLVVADPGDEAAYLPALQAAGFQLRVREPWWHGHRLLRHSSPACHLHVFELDSPELIRHRIFRDWLAGNPDDHALYARTKDEAARASRQAGEHSMEYNARKEEVIRAIYRRAFLASGLLKD